MGKKYVPSGYQIIEIDITRLDENNILSEETEDEKVLYELFKTKKIIEKPVLLKIKNGPSTLLSGLATAYGNEYLFLSGIYLNEGVIDVAFYVRIRFNDEEKIVVNYGEL